MLSWCVCAVMHNNILSVSGDYIIEYNTTILFKSGALYDIIVLISCMT